MAPIHAWELGFAFSSMKIESYWQGRFYHGNKLTFPKTNERHLKGGKTSASS